MSDTGRRNSVFSLSPAASFARDTLQHMDRATLAALIANQQRHVAHRSQLLVRELKRRDHQQSRVQAKCNMLTAILHAMSQKRSE